MLRSTLLSLCLLCSACSGGSINAALTLPRPGGATTLPGGGLEMRAGIVVSTSDGVDVCQRIRVRVFTAAARPPDLEKPPADARPVAEGRGVGTYTAEQPSCSVLVVNLPPRADYWLVLDYPARSPSGEAYYTFGRPSLSQPPPMVLGLYPVKVVDKQTTQLSATMIGPGYTAPPPPGA
jgi:hypothetical protein